MKVAEFFKLVEAKAIKLRDVINAMLQLTAPGAVLTTEDVLKRPSLAGTAIDWELRTDKRRHIAALYTEYLLLSAELSHMLSVEVDWAVAEPGVSSQEGTSPKNSPPTAAANISPNTPL